jgi:hypothetical protein
MNDVKRSVKYYLLKLISIFIKINSESMKYKWGILGPGKMSAKFTRGRQLLENAE